jgi:serine/threonine protein kinase
VSINFQTNKKNRDMKSLNVLLTDKHRAKLGDFGLAKVNQTGGSSDSTVVGSYNWMGKFFEFGQKKRSRQVVPGTVVFPR